MPLECNLEQLIDGSLVYMDIVLFYAFLERILALIYCLLVSCYISNIYPNYQIKQKVKRLRHSGQ